MNKATHNFSSYIKIGKIQITKSEIGSWKNIDFKTVKNNFIKSVSCVRLRIIKDLMSLCELIREGIFGFSSKI